MSRWNAIKLHFRFSGWQHKMITSKNPAEFKAVQVYVSFFFCKPLFRKTPPLYSSPYVYWGPTTLPVPRTVHIRPDRCSLAPVWLSRVCWFARTVTPAEDHLGLRPGGRLWGFGDGRGSWAPAVIRNGQAEEMLQGLSHLLWTNVVNRMSRSLEVRNKTIILNCCNRQKNFFQ